MTSADSAATRSGTSPALRLTVRPVPSSLESEVTAEFHGPGAPVRASGAAVLRIDRFDQETLRWYFEEYLQYPAAPAPEIARQAERRITELGETWFSRIFLDNSQLQPVWAAAAPVLSSISVEIDDATPEGAAIPWELLRPPGEAALPLRVHSFTRTPSHPAQEPSGGRGATPDQTEDHPVRVLLVISRPAGIRDVPFRAVAQALLDESAAASSRLEVSVLRPATFEAFQARLAEAVSVGQPFDIVHFDGHGAHAETGPERGSSPPRRRGCVVFESESGDGQLLPGSIMGAALRAGHVGALVLNACRSAHADGGEEATADSPPSGPEAFPSFATEALGAGVRSVLAMRYDVFVDTAVATTAAVYRGLGLGMSLAEAATEARRRLAADPMRTVIGPPRPLADWIVPVVFETAGTLPASGAASAAARPTSRPAAPVLGSVLPSQEFVGRDSAILALDRAFDSYRIVALRGMIGSGKSATAAEFTRWYVRTGGADAADRATDLPAGSAGRRILRVIDDLDAILADAPDSSAARHAIEAMAANAKVLLVSRGEVTSWLPSAVEVDLGSMTTADQLAMLTRGRNADPAGLEALWPRVREARGNPALLEEILGSRPASRPVSAQLVRDCLVERFTPAELESLGLLAFFRGRVDLEMLSHMTAFNPGQPAVTGEQWFSLLRRLADAGMATHIGGISYALHPSLAGVLSQTAASASDDAAEEAFLLVMAAFGEQNSVEFRRGDPQAVRWAYNAEENLRAAFDRVVRRGAWLYLQGVMLGLLTGYESAHQFDAWDRLLDQLTPLVFHPGADAPAAGMEYTWGFVSEWVMERHRRRGEHERALGLQRSRLEYDAGVLKGLLADPVALDGYPQYKHMLAFHGPGHPENPGHEPEGPEPQGNRLRILREDMLRGFAVSMSDYGDMLRDRGAADCVDAYLRALELFEGLGDSASIAKTSHALSWALLKLPQIRDLDAAEQMAEQSLRFRSPEDVVGRAVSYGQLGNVFHERFRAKVLDKKGSATRMTDPENLRLIAQAAVYFERSLAATPEWDLKNLGPAHNQLGGVYIQMRKLDEARRHYAEAITAYESIGNFELANSSRMNLAAGLMTFQRFAEARMYAREAADYFARFPDQEMSQRLRALTHVIDELEREWPRTQQA